MYAVFVPTPVSDGIMEPGQFPDPQTRTMVHTRRGRTYVSLHRARALAQKHLGQVRIAFTNKIVEDFLL
jgi:hypothetical protein